MEPIPNKWYCHQKGRPRSPQSIDICPGLLSVIERMMTPQPARGLAAVFGRRISGQHTVYGHLVETGLDAHRPAVCVPMTASSWKNGILRT
ncbi:hypothetical protein TNCV_1349761 [Trichonephila clavipes]|nr:hypothetical protein TNCV_1349761 [Trichonephila clavipes]